ncbi:MAG TPA: hypothetical protein VFE51_30670 [Verrucomicrobiae bacterium]|nr:hypothetical protein [Verrucomicrobiae bacterium]
MSWLRYWKIALGLVLVFGAGVVTGSIATHQVIKIHFEQALNFERWKAGVMHVLQSKLNLSAPQSQKIAVLVDTRGQEIRQSFSNAFNESGHALVHLQAQIDQELTPAQREIHAQMKRDFRAELKKRFNFELPPE